MTTNVVPIRLHRTRGKGNITPEGATYVGRPTIFGNPFERRHKIGHARSVILYRTWLDGNLSPRILRCAGFSESEINGIARWRAKLMPQLPRLRGRNLQCWCPLTSDWCHAAVLLRVVNAPVLQLAA